MKIIQYPLYAAILLTGTCGLQESAKKSTNAPSAPPTMPLVFDKTVSDIEAVCASAKSDLLASVAVVESVSAPTFANTALALEKATTKYWQLTGPLTFMKYVSSDESVRKAAGACELEAETLFVDLFAREALFSKLSEFQNTKPALSAIDAKLLQETIISFEENGLKLSAQNRKKFLDLKKKLVKLEADFSSNLGEWSDPLAVTEAELDGMGKDFISGLEKNKDGKYLLTLSYPHYYPFMQQGKNAEIRKKMQQKFFHRGGEANKLLLEEAIKIRHELANLRGFKNHRTTKLSRKMAKDPATVESFLSVLKSKLKPKGEENLKELLELKKAEVGPKETTVHAWDWRYYENELKIARYQIDQEEIKQYFPLDTVLGGMFKIYQDLLGVKFVEVKGSTVWHESVAAYAVVDPATNKAIAYFYMDLFPRAGKYSHAAAFTLVSGYSKEDGSYNSPVSSIVANFNAPTAGQKSLLLHSQVETLFHEFGHIMHQILTTAEYASFSGTSVKRDFVEAPSQMLENWVWEKEGLNLLSSHVKTGKKLPEALLNKLIAAKSVNSGIRYLRQVFFATLDMTYHASAKVDTTKVYKDLLKEIMLIELPGDTIPQASFGHLMGGYDAGYYGYLWSEVYAQDMYTRFAKEGLFSPKAGGDYRRWILEPGGSLEPMELLVKFLGRKPNTDAFLKSLGID